VAQSHFWKKIFVDFSGNFLIKEDLKEKKSENFFFQSFESSTLSS